VFSSQIQAKTLSQEIQPMEDVHFKQVVAKTNDSGSAKSGST
jgi:hypothetical protein